QRSLPELPEHVLHDFLRLLACAENAKRDPHHVRRVAGVQRFERVRLARFEATQQLPVARGRRSLAHRQNPAASTWLLRPAGGFGCVRFAKRPASMRQGARRRERMQLGPLGVWYFTESLPAPQAAEFAQRVEALGYSALWLPEAVGRHPFAQCAWLLAKTERLILAARIARIYARGPGATAAGQKTLAEHAGA